MSPHLAICHVHMASADTWALDEIQWGRGHHLSFRHVTQNCSGLDNSVVTE